MNITILGCGAYGLSLASMFKINNCNIKLWNKFDDKFDEFRDRYPNYLFTNDLEESIKDCDLIVVAIPLLFLESVIVELANVYDKQDILIASKGINVNDGLFASDIINKYLPNACVGAVSGGTFACDMINKKVMGLTLGTNCQSITDKVKKGLANRFLKVQYTNDLLGVQICGSIKNVMAIGFGILDGADYPASSKFLFLAEAFYEIQELIVKLGGNKDTVTTYAGIDDIMMTCTSSESRNYTLGRLIGEKREKDVIDDYKNNTTIEGLGTCLAINSLCYKNNLILPICKIIFDILYNDGSPDELINYLEEKES